MIKLSPEPNLVAIVVFLESSLCLDVEPTVPAYKILGVCRWRAPIWCISVEIFDSNQDPSNPVLGLDFCRFIFDVDPSCLYRVKSCKELQSNLHRTCRLSLVEPIDTRRRIERNRTE